MSPKKNSPQQKTEAVAVLHELGLTGDQAFLLLGRIVNVYNQVSVAEQKQELVEGSTRQVLGAEEGNERALLSWGVDTKAHTVATVEYDDGKTSAKIDVDYDPINKAGKVKYLGSAALFGRYKADQNKLANGIVQKIEQLVVASSK